MMRIRWTKSILLGVAVTLIATTMLFFLQDKSSASVQPCAVGHCPKEITIADNGALLTYRVGRRFSVILDRREYPPEKLLCDTEGTIEKTLSLRDLYPNQMQRFLAKNPGTCVLQDRDFRVTIEIQSDD